jgi:ABC-2 type transport system permease protein
MLYIPFIISSTFLGLTIAPLFVTREIALVALLCTSVPNVFLAGFSWPPESMPRLLRLFSLAVPNSTGVDAYLRITQMGADRYDVEWQIRHLWILSAVYFVTALLMSRFAVALPKDPLPCDQQVPTTEAFPETSVS